MSDNTSTFKRRLSQIKDILTVNRTATTIPFDPNATKFPTRKELPEIQGAPPGAAWVWGENDFVGRLNLLTPTRVKAASAEIKTGDIVPLNLPLNVPETPAFHREKFQHTIKTLREGVAFDDVSRDNPPSGTQWDGFRHFAHMSSQTFYNNTKAADIIGPHANEKCSIHHWSNHGVAGRGVLLDYRSWASKKGIHYDPFERHEISYDELYQCGKDQGIDIRPQAQGGDIMIGDLLFIRSGFNEAYKTKSLEERMKAATRDSNISAEAPMQWSGVLQEDKILDWLHDSYFAAVAGDAPAFEAWPSQKGLSLY
ncbi:hypothetical protein MMC20_004539 [Loxospora ochrophaea]|nr:hypothetical protein [Loxospora ochrophaea]